MTLIMLTSIGCIIYLALGTVLTLVMFHRRQRERKLDFFFSAKKSPRSLPEGGVWYDTVGIVPHNNLFFFFWPTGATLPYV
jgi:hypothetical protein